MARVSDLVKIAHDAGGQLRWRFDDNVEGSATISDDGKYRWSLSRDWTRQGEQSNAILWIGMNPSTADAQLDDPTCRREVNFSKNWGFSCYLKGNVLGYRSTDPNNLPVDPAEAEGPNNRDHLLKMALQVETIVLCYGNLPPRYHKRIGETIAMLRDLSAELVCLGRNQSGSPKHPLYLSSQTAPQPF